MPTTIKLKNSVTTTNAPSSLAQGEVAINVTDKKVWVGNAATTPVQLLGTGADGSFTNLAYTGTLTGGTGVVNLGSGQFYKDASGNIGVGTASPSFPLDVAGAIRGNSWIGRTNTSAPSTDAFIYRPADNTLGLGTASTERMRIAANGFVGIGTSSPSGLLHVSGGVNTYQRISNTANSVNIDFVATTAVGYLGTSSNHATGFTTNDVERMRIDTSGNVMIGGTVASAKLTVFSDISLRSGAAELSRINGQTATSVSTSATNILPITFGYGALAIVNGYSGGNVFNDLVFFGNTTATAVTSQTSGGSPVARTYTVVSGQLRLAMASGTYTVTAVQQYINAY